jgi:hypothetical protein
LAFRPLPRVAFALGRVFALFSCVTNPLVDRRFFV